MLLFLIAVIGGNSYSTPPPAPPTLHKSFSDRERDPYGPSRIAAPPLPLPLLLLTSALASKFSTFSCMRSKASMLVEPVMLPSMSFT